MRKKKEACNHDPQAKDTSIIILDKFTTMVAPDRDYGVCRVCRKSFEFIKPITQRKEESLYDFDVERDDG